MPEKIKVERPTCWSFYCKEKDENLAMESISQNEAILNIYGNEGSEYLISRVENMVKKSLVNCVTGSQLRKLYNQVDALEPTGNLNQIRIQLIYIAARQNNPAAQGFVEFIKALMNHIEGDKQRLKRFQDFMESVVSYHKFYSKK